MPEAASVRIDNASTGEFALLCALVRPQCEIHAVECDPKRRAVAARALSLPENLHLHACAADVPPDALRYRLDDGRPVAAADETDACVTIVPVR